MTQAYNLSQLANNLDTSGRLDATDGLINAVPATNGGTGQAGYAVGDLLYASTTTALSKLADVATGNALLSGGVNLPPAYGKVGLATHVSGTLPVGNGGTGATTLASNNVLLGNGASAPQTVAPGASGNVLTSNGTTWASVAPATPSSGVTSLNGQTGAITDTSLYAIGSYIIGRPADSFNYAANSTVAGSSLYATSMIASYDPTSSPSWLNAKEVLVNVGTWRCMSVAWGNATYPYNGIGYPGLWVRIS